MSLIERFFGIEPAERLKVALLTCAFFLIIGSYTLVHQLKDTLFVHIVGKEYIPVAKILSLVLLVLPILLYAKLVDSMRKHHLLYVYTIFYGLLGLYIAYFLAHPTIGLANTVTSKYRIFGWLIYIFMEGYSPFVASLFWSFVNSVTQPESSKNSYPILIAGSKIGGIVAAGFAIWLLRPDPITHTLWFSDIANHQILMSIAACSLLLVPGIIYILVTKVPHRYLHSYESIHRPDHELPPEEKQNWLARLFSGLTLLFRYPYILGIFGVVFFWEVLNTVFAYERLGVGKTIAVTISDYTRFLFDGIIFVHLIGLVIVLFGTRMVINWLGERRSLVLVPVLTGILSLYYLTQRSATAILVVFVCLRALNYAFAQALRERLYIPTTRDMRFKSRSWIDAFGSKFAKSSGSLYNLFIQTVAPTAVGSANAAFFAVIIGAWIATAYLLGRRFERAVQRNEVIGLQ